MNTKATITTLAAALLLGALLFPAAAPAQDDEMTIGSEYYGFEQRERAPVIFTHTKHMELEMVDGYCAPCHHDGKDESGAFVEGDTIPCRDCHAVEGDESMPGLMDSYHELCIDCHRDAGEGPLTCGECHVQTDFFGIPLGGDDSAQQEAEGHE